MHNFTTTRWVLIIAVIVVVATAVGSWYAITANRRNVG
jgi:hypothetical protein